jgi:hypothetical protein
MLLDKTTMRVNIFSFFVVYFFNENAEHYSLPAFISKIEKIKN